MSDENFEGERLTVTRVELGLVALLAVVAAVPFVFGLGALVVLGVVLTVVVMALILYLAKGGPLGKEPS